MRTRYHFKAKGTPVASTVACGRRVWNLGMNSHPTAVLARVTCKACLRMIKREPWITEVAEEES